MTRYLDLVTSYICEGMTLEAAEAAARKIINEGN